MRPMSSLNRAVGAAAGSTLALALLVAGCVFAAMAGPALSLYARSQALHQTTAKLVPTVKTVQVSANWTNFADSLVNYYGNNVAQAKVNLTPGQLARATQEIKGTLAGLPLPLGPGAWYGLSAQPVKVATGAAPSAMLSGAQPALEVLYRDSLTGNAELVTGSYSAGPEPAGTLAVAVTPQTAARFGLRPGSRMTVVSLAGIITLAVTAIVRQRQAGLHLLDPGPAGQPALAGHPGGNEDLLGGRGLRGSGPAGCDADRVQQPGPGAVLGVPARARRPERGPGAGTGQCAQPGHHGHAGADRAAGARPRARWPSPRR